MPVLSIPNLSPVGWEPGVITGVLGGIEQYRPGGVNERTNLLDVVADYSADDTGATSSVTAVGDACSAAATNDVIYFPYGVFYLPTSSSLNFKQVTVRGAGGSVPSSSSVTMGIGSKVFEVEAGLGWTAGKGIRIWDRKQRHKWLQGTVTSYTGTTLTVDVTTRSRSEITSITRSGGTATATTSSASHGVKVGDVVDISGADQSEYNGDQTVVSVIDSQNFTFSVSGSPATPATGTIIVSNADTLNEWAVGRTVLLSNGLFSHSTSNGFGTTAITDSPVAGDTVVTVADASGLVANSTATITMLQATNDLSYHHHPSPRISHTYQNWITGISGNDVTLARPIPEDLPVAQVPQLSSGAFGGAKNVGYEDFDAFGPGYTSINPLLISLSGLYNSWLYNVSLGLSNSYTLAMGNSVACEIAYSYIGHSWGGGGSSAACISHGGTCYCLLRNVVTTNGLITEGVADHINAYFACYEAARGLGGIWYLNHGSGSRFRVVENCVVPMIKWDSYHGGAQKDTTFRTWCNELDFGIGGKFGLLVAGRYQYYNNNVEIVLGKSGSAQGIFSEGNPNIGTSANDGDVATPVEWVETGGVSGVLHKHDDATGNSRMTGVIASHSGTEITITLDSPNTVENRFSDPIVLGGYGFPHHVVWGAGGDDTHARGNCTINYGASSGSTIVIDGASGGGEAFPADATNVAIKLGEYGHQELDGSVSASAFTKKIYAFGAAGIPGSLSNDTSDTLPESLVYPTKPSDWPDAITWPPEISTANPDIPDDVIPAVYYFNHGFWPTGPDTTPPSPVSFTVNGTTWTLHCNESGVTVGVDGDDGLTVTMSGGAVTLTYTSGDGTSNRVYTGSRSIAHSETGTADYVPPGDGIQDDDGNLMEAFADFTVTNSTPSPSMGDINTIVQASNSAPVIELWKIDGTEVAYIHSGDYPAGDTWDTDTGSVILPNNGTTRYNEHGPNDELVYVFDQTIVPDLSAAIAARDAL